MSERVNLDAAPDRLLLVCADCNSRVVGSVKDTDFGPFLVTYEDTDADGRARGVSPLRREKRADSDPDLVAGYLELLAACPRCGERALDRLELERVYDEVGA